MTLIVGVLTKNYVVLASDRRVTWLGAAGPSRHEDSAMKAFALEGRFMMGFTGLAEPGRVPMAEWLRQVLADVPPERVLETLRSAIQSHLDRERLPSGGPVPHAFAGVGFDGDDAVATGFYISNHLDPRGLPDPSNVSNDVLIRTLGLGNQRQHVFTIGYRVRAAARRKLVHEVRQALRANPNNPSLLVIPVIELIRDVAARSNGMVGETILFSSVPRSAVPVQTWLLAPGAPDPASRSREPIDFMGSAVAMYFPLNSLAPIDQEAIASDATVTYMPAIYGASGAMVETWAVRQNGEYFLPMPDKNTPAFTFRSGDMSVSFDPQLLPEEEDGLE